MEKIETPFGIHAEFVSDRAVQNCINMYKKDSHRIKPGLSGQKEVLTDWKDSLDLGLNHDEIDRLKIWHKEMHDVIDNYMRKFPILAKFSPWGYVEGVNIQYYKPGGGFKREHCERMSLSSINRLFAFMLYLNEDHKGGKTIFTNYNLKIKPKKDNLLIWPAEWTHSHYAEKVLAGNKYIITGWIQFPYEY